MLLVVVDVDVDVDVVNSCSKTLAGGRYPSKHSWGPTHWCVNSGRNDEEEDEEDREEE